MKKTFTRKIAGSLTAAILLSAGTTPLAHAAAYAQLPQGYELVRISNPQNNPQDIDGFWSPEMGNAEEYHARGQSYAWSAIEYGDHIYIGTVYNPISGIFYRTVKSALIQLGLNSSDADQVTDSFVSLMYDNHFYKYEEGKTYPVIIKVDKQTHQIQLVRQDGPGSDMGLVHGYRNVVAFEGRLYFAAMSYPSGSLLEIDPANDQSKVVYQLPNNNPRVSGGIRGLAVYNGEVIMSIANQDGIKIVKTKTPWDSSSWGEDIIADQQTFNDLPAFFNSDSINGGAIWDIAEFNGDLYVSIVTGKTDMETGVNDKRGFALYRGTRNQNGTLDWQAIIGDTEGEGVHKAIYPFGLGSKESGAGNIFAYKDHLYIGGYNDPMLDLAAIPNKGDFSKLYGDLANPANLYRMDKTGKIEMVIGDKDEIFPEGAIGSVSDVMPGESLAGFGNPMNQYIWRMAEMDGKLFVGTYDTTSITSPFFQLTNGNLADLSAEDFQRRFEQLKSLFQDLLAALPIGEETQESTEKAKMETETAEDVISEKDLVIAELEAAETELELLLEEKTAAEKDLEEVKEQEKILSNEMTTTEKTETLLEENLKEEEVPLLDLEAPEISENPVEEENTAESVEEEKEQIKQEEEEIKLEETEEGKEKVEAEERPIQEKLEALFSKEEELRKKLDLLKEKLADLQLPPKEAEEKPEENELIEEESYTAEDLENMVIHLEELSMLFFDQSSYKDILKVKDWEVLQKNRVELYKEIVALYTDQIRQYLPSGMQEKVDDLLLSGTLEQFVYYFAISDFTSKAIEGFDFFVSEDGANFVTLTRDGFGDPHNHGVRTLTPTEQGLFIGTANPFYGGQLYLLKRDGTVIEVEEGELDQGGVEKNDKQPDEEYKVVNGEEKDDLPPVPQSQVPSVAEKEVYRPASSQPQIENLAAVQTAESKELPNTGKAKSNLFVAFGAPFALIGSGLGILLRKKNKKRV